MKKLIALAIFTSSLLLSAQAQLSGINLNQITNMMSPSKLMNMLPNSNQASMMGLDQNTMKLLMGSQENLEDKEKKNLNAKPGAIATPNAGDVVPSAISADSPDGIFNAMY